MSRDYLPQEIASKHKGKLLPLVTKRLNIFNKDIAYPLSLDFSTIGTYKLLPAPLELGTGVLYPLKYS